MIIYKNLRQVLFGGLAFSLILAIASCSNEKQEPSPSNSEDLRKEKILKELPTIVNKLSKIKVIYKEDKGKGNKNGDGFSFSDAGDGFTFANPSGNTYTDDEGYVVITTPGFGSNSGGSVTAGNNAYEITETFCLAAESETDGDGEDVVDFLFGDGLGISLIIGISGNFDEAIEDGEIIDLNAIVLYLVFDDRAQGSYEVLNFLDNLEDTEGDLPTAEDAAFAVIQDFENDLGYVSASGNLNVSGGNITFSGEYFEFDFRDGGEDILIEDDGDFGIVPGGGTMGCQ